MPSLLPRGAFGAPMMSVTALAKRVKPTRAEAIAAWRARKSAERAAASSADPHPVAPSVATPATCVTATAPVTENAKLSFSE